MSDQAVKHIICAIRGQPESRETASRAIDLALDHHAKLTFCLVIMAEFLGKASPTLTPLSAAYRQLEDMGKFSLLILVDRAKRRGVKEVDFLIRKGDIQQQLRRLVSEIDAEIIVLGRPVRNIGKSIFTPQEFDRFIERLEEENGIQVVEVFNENNQ